MPAAAAAVLAAVARHDGHFHAAVFLAVFSAFLLLTASFLLIPGLAAYLKLDVLGRLRFFRFTRRGVFFVLVVVLIAFSSLNTGNNLLVLILSMLMAALIVSGLVSNLVLHDLGVSLQAPEAIFAGQRAIFRLTLQNGKRFFPSFGLRLRSRQDTAQEAPGTDFFLQEKVFPYVHARGKLSSNLECRFDRRGVYPVAGFEVRTSFPFGFFSRGSEISATGSIVVYPRLYRVERLLTSFPQLEGAWEKNVPGTGGSLYNIREFQSGDTARSVHWKSTAKTSRLMVKVLAAEEEETATVALSRFVPAMTPGNIADFERAVSCVASLCSYYYGRRRSFRFCSADLQIKVEGRADSYRTLMEFLATVQPSVQETLDPQKLPCDAVVFAAGGGGALPWSAVIDCSLLAGDDGEV